jgi:hypothetical protein
MTKRPQIPAVSILRPEQIRRLVLFPYEGELAPVIQLPLKNRFVNTLEGGDVVIASPERFGSVELDTSLSVSNGMDSSSFSEWLVCTRHSGASTPNCQGEEESIPLLTIYGK